MRLYSTATSPFVRKVMVVAHELGITLETEVLRPTPIAADPELSKQNPLSKIPVLLTPEGPLFDSAVICEYLDPAHALVPASGADRFRVLRIQALCDGILEAGILVFYELSQRPKELHWRPWIDGQTEKANQSLDALESEIDQFGAFDFAHVCVGVTLGWLEFRKPIGDVRARRPKLFEFYDRLCQRPSMLATVPHT